MVLSAELTYVLAFLLPLVELSSNHSREKFLSLDKAHLYVSVRVAIEGKLTSYACRQRVEYSEIILCEVCLHEVDLFAASEVLCLRSSKDVVELCDELLDSRDELDDTLWDEDCTEVVTVSSTVGNCLSDVSNDVVETHFLCLYFLTYKTDVRLTLESTLKGDVTCTTSHEFDEVPVFTSRVTVALDVTDKL